MTSLNVRHAVSAEYLHACSDCIVCVDLHRPALFVRRVSQAQHEGVPLQCPMHFQPKRMRAVVWTSVVSVFATVSGLRQLAPLSRRSVLTRSTQALAFVMALPSKTSGEACASAAPDDLPAIMKAVTRGSAGVFSFDENFATPVLTSPNEVLVEIKASRRRPMPPPPEPPA